MHDLDDENENAGYKFKYYKIWTQFENTRKDSNSKLKVHSETVLLITHSGETMFLRITW